MGSENEVAGGGKGRTARRVGLSSELIVERALRLTEERGLAGWSIRDLAAALDVVPSVVYHYFPKKDDVVDAVVGQICERVEMPDPHLGWKEWFTELCLAMRPLLLEYHGVAEHLTTGRLTESVVPIIDLAAAKLQEAGFGDSTPLVYSMVFDVAVGAIAARDRRSPKARTPEDMKGLIARLEPLMEHSPGVSLMVHSFFEPLTDVNQADAMSDKYFRLIIESIIDGIEHVVLPRVGKK
ncbi:MULTISPECIES: TetR/AcrR family transcriptional regulator [unclassified Actinobaculum]|uniref:TetR/AcrR family transcriptional regulator n=1 Tax=unclassified Actinobaculum TaxID=2609299 RepID=UPI000D529305|nr:MULTISPECIES: TetR/AcrR family transcriptional regulator [unclassified Actinobaculum]AWE41890.1 TetR family transcriptional regulator [Actinobaculum sp. 313]RTE50194.1 TetR/AcrR family transcriptional regulator [Actinobaculum sp. 352]